MNIEQFKLSKVEIKALCKPNYRASYFVFALNIFLFASYLVGFFLASNTSGMSGTLLSILSIFLWALHMNHSYLLVHETCHGSFLNSSNKNIFIGHIASFFAIMPFYTRREEHTMHHRVSGSYQEGTNWRAMERFLVIKPFLYGLISVCWKLWIPIFAFNEQLMLWKMAFKKDRSLKKRRTAACQLISYATVLFVFMYLFSPKVVAYFLLVNFLPSLYLYMVLVEYFNVPHHLDSPIDDITGTVPYYEQMKYTKSCAPLPRPFNYIYALNFNYHEAHHLYPSLHWSQLKKAHDIMKKYDANLGKLEPEYRINFRLHKKPLREAFWKYFEFLPIFNERNNLLKQTGN